MIKLSDHFGACVCSVLKHKFNAEFVDDLIDVPDNMLLSCRNIGRKFVFRLRALQSARATEFETVYIIRRTWKHPLRTIWEGECRSAKEWAQKLGEGPLIGADEFESLYEEGKLGTWFEKAIRPKANVRGKT